MSKLSYPLYRYFFAWAVHIFTASGAIIGVLTLAQIHHKAFNSALWLMALTILIDAIDGSFARLVSIKEVLPKIDGALLDNIIDYLNYVITPCFFLLVEPTMLPASFAWFTISIITLSSAYQFTQFDAKTPDHFFKGFPSYWNILVFYLYLFHFSAYTNTTVLLFFSVLVFVPIKYVYPSRLDYLTEIKWLKITMLLASIAFGFVSVLLLWLSPKTPSLLIMYVLAYIIFYISFSLFRTWVPMIKARLQVKGKIT